ncbi:hypothetical protein Rta_17090 [Ramlibacter tataouinensis TTB310]|uniref:Transglycosylase SLT domain-containing protein n=2 Tax=Ramlibacter tataouinensis TaxID=94132 RepID=F5Y6B3_RAMTT|nr:hypothetical protein Rta_17090 [Ramlibacter tataouinensis TTB310]
MPAPVPASVAIEFEPMALEEAPTPEPSPLARRYQALRERLRWVPTRLGRDMHLTPDLPSRLLLVKSAAQEARLHEVGLGFADVYGLITAETSWVPRLGRSRDGTPNLGVAQFEPATAKAVGLQDPHDVVEAVHAAARHMREAAEWSRQRIAGLKLNRAERAARLREGVSIYYNLSSRGREAWDGRNTERLPVQTRQHIRNARSGAAEAAVLATRLALPAPPAGVAPVAQRPHPPLHAAP